eukprot:gene2996-3741_t
MIDSFTKRLNRLNQSVYTLLKQIVLLPIWIYQAALAPYLTPCCRFHPTCSAYAHEAISKYGIIYGSWLTFKRLLRCHPLGKSGYDPVPQAPNKQ